MRIVYDGSVYAMQPVGGINRYFANIIARLPGDVTPVLTLSRYGELNLPAHANLQVRRAGFTSFPKPLRRWLVRRHFHRVLRRERADILHPTYYDVLSGRDVRQYHLPLVITVYDMIHERFPGMLDRRGKAAAAKRLAVQHADAILCISHHTKQDLLELCPVSEQRVHVVHLASDLDELTSGLAGAPATELARFLYVGSRAPYKNFSCLLSAMQKLVGRVPDVRLQVVGAPFSRVERADIAQRGLAGHIIEYGHVVDAQLARLYRSSTALVYPSLYEGFGIPLLEAMGCGTVVVAANRSSIPEVVGDSGILFDPHSPEELAAILLRLVEHPQEREPWIARGRLRATQFSWNRTVDQTMAVYRQVAAWSGSG